MKTLRVKNFEKFQHYKDRTPPWIKLYNDLLDDYEFGALSDASKFHLVAIWLLASRSDNRLPYDSKWIARRINATDAVDLDELVKSGFLVVDQELHTPEQVASEPLSLARSRETEGEERRGETEGGADAPPNLLVIEGGAVDYVFPGKTIRLKRDQYDAWRRNYGHVGRNEGVYRSVLQAADDYFTDRPSEDGKWFFRTSAWLERENRKMAEAEAKAQNRSFN